jgi:hypothetical protein
VAAVVTVVEAVAVAGVVANETAANNFREARLLPGLFF